MIRVDRSWKAPAQSTDWALLSQAEDALGVLVEDEAHDSVVVAEFVPLLEHPLAEGMLFSFEPNACHGRHRVNIGGTVAVGPSGPEELNTLPCRLHEVG